MSFLVRSSVENYFITTKIYTSWKRELRTYFQIQFWKLWDTRNGILWTCGLSSFYIFHLTLQNNKDYRVVDGLCKRCLTCHGFPCPFKKGKLKLKKTVTQTNNVDRDRPRDWCLYLFQLYITSINIANTYTHTDTDTHTQTHTNIQTTVTETASSLTPYCFCMYSNTNISVYITNILY